MWNHNETSARFCFFVVTLRFEKIACRETFTVIKSAVVYWIHISCVWLYLHVFPARADVPGGLPSPVSPHLPSLVEETQAATQRRKRRKTAGGGCNRSCVDTVQRTSVRYDLVDIVAWRGASIWYDISVAFSWFERLHCSEVMSFSEPDYSTSHTQCVDSLWKYQLSPQGSRLTFPLEKSALLWRGRELLYDVKLRSVLLYNYDLSVWCKNWRLDSLTHMSRYNMGFMCMCNSSLYRLPLLCELLCRHNAAFFSTMIIWSCVTSRPHRRNLIPTCFDFLFNFVFLLLLVLWWPR